MIGVPVRAPSQITGWECTNHYRSAASEGPLLPSDSLHHWYRINHQLMTLLISMMEMMICQTQVPMLGRGHSSQTSNSIHCNSRQSPSWQMTCC